MDDDELVEESFCSTVGHVAGLVGDTIDGAKEQIDQAMDGVAMIAAKLLPKRVAWWAYVRVMHEPDIKESLKESIQSWFEGDEFPFMEVCDECGACVDAVEKGDMN